jgi:hypothetical protein
MLMMLYMYGQADVRSFFANPMIFKLLTVLPPQAEALDKPKNA